MRADQNTRDDESRWHTLHAAEAVAAVESDADSGLAPDEARRRLEALN